jgi:HK97 gp10 family phage protein
VFGFSVDTTEVTSFAQDLADTKTEILAGIRTVVQRTTKAVERDAKRFVPVDTGNLRNSLASETSEDGDTVVGEIYATAGYAAHVEFGTSKMPPHAFLRPSLDRNSYAFEKAITQVAKRALRK